MKHGAPLTVPQQWNPPSLFLSSYMRPVTHRQLVKWASEGPLWVLAGLSGSCLFLTVLLQMITTSPLRYYYPQDSLDLKQAMELWDTYPSTPPLPKILYTLLSSQYIWLYVFLPFLSAVLPCRPPPPPRPHLACSSSISKQTHFLLTRRLVAVICCACQVEYWATLWPLSTKGRPRKLEGRRYLCIEWIISPTRHSAFSLCVACNRHAACRCQDSSLVASAKHSACNALLNSFARPEYYTRHSYLLPHTILRIDHLARRVDGRRTYLWGFYQISFLGALWGCIAIKHSPVLQSFHLFLLFFYCMLSTRLCLFLPCSKFRTRTFLCLIAHMSVFVCIMLLFSRSGGFQRERSSCGKTKNTPRYRTDLECQRKDNHQHPFSTALITPRGALGGCCYL